MKGGSRVSQMMQFLSKKQLSRCQVSRNEDNEPCTPGGKNQRPIDLLDNKPPPIAGCHPFYLTQRFFFCVCIVAPHLRLFHVQLSKLLVGALQDFAERTLTDPGARGPTDTWAVSLRAIWVQMVNICILEYIYIYIWLCVKTLYPW